jgi:hypothetical protein
MFFHIVFLFYFFIFQNYIYRFFLILRISFCNFFSLKHCWLLQCFFAWFFLWFSPKLSFLFYFLILSWLKITVTICEENTVTFLENYCWLLQCFFPYGFFFCFCYVFPKNYLCQFYFLNIKLVKNCNYKFFLTKHYGLIQFFLIWFFFSFFCVFFFVIFFFKIIFVDFFLILSWLEFNFVIKLNHVEKAL